LSLTNFRNYHRLELDLPAGPAVIEGENAQGKTNLLESVYFLATSKSHRASTDSELLRHGARDEDVPVARVEAEAVRARGVVEVEFALRAEKRAAPTTEGEAESVAPVRKRVMVNGVARRSSELVGQINVVLFTAQDIELATGKPGLCRRYLDLVSCQLDRVYLRSLQRYQKVLVQRNHLLKLLQEGQAQPDQLEFWDDELVKSGSYLVVQRSSLVQALDRHARGIHRDISGGGEELRVAYAPNVEAEWSLAEVEACFRDALQRKRRREISQGVTLAGPHRDSVSFSVNGTDVTRFGSRGQQQTVVLSLKLAEARHMQVEVKDYPIILLDDVFSELDLTRRKHLLALVTLYQQVLITSTHLDCFEPSFLANCARFHVSAGVIEPA
jgi:DNA replication and repair protein RecF